MQRWRPAAVLIAWLSLLAAAAAQDPGAPGGPVALLIRNPDTVGGEPPYALADQYGRVQRLVEATPRLDLSRHVGQRVRIKHDTGRTLLASQLELPSLAATSAPPEPLREVSPAQFVPPRRARPIDPEGRRYRVRPAQAAEDAGGGFEDLPGPAPTPADPTEPIDLDALPQPDESGRLEPIPADADTGDYEEVPYETGPYEEVPTLEPMQSGRGPLPTPGHPPDCPHCRAAAPPAVDYCETCGRTAGWCAPTCNPPSERGFYGRAEYLIWWLGGMTTPPLATDNTSGNQPALEQPGTRILYGGHELLDDARSGLRFTVGAWLDNRRDIAVEADWLNLETESDTFTSSDPAGSGILGRPYYSVATVDEDTLAIGPPAESAQIVAFTGEAGGALAIYTRSQFQTAGLRLRTGVCCRGVGGGGGACGCESCRSGLLGIGGGARPQAISRIDFVAGYRYADLEELLRFDQNTNILSGSAAGNTYTASEAFSVDNEFHGVDLGFVYDWRAKRWGLELVSKIAVGATSQRVSISGNNTVGVVGAADVTSAGGLLTQASNLGVYERDRFSVLPELSARVSYRITPRLSLSAAYSLLYWANVVRPGDQIDYSVDDRLAAGLVAPTASSHPRFDWEETSLWAHGLNFGLDYRY